MPQFGVEMRAKPFLVVLRGFDPNQPFSKTQAYPVKAADVDVIKSGMVISAELNGSTNEYEWEIGWSAGRIPYIALQDGNQYDVVSANSLVGYSCLGDFVLQTGYYTAGAYVVNSPVSPDGTTGNIKLGVAGNGEPIMGYITAPVTDLSSGGATGYPSISAVTDANVVAFQTAWLPANAND
jgi:hypothetical protein